MILYAYRNGYSRSRIFQSEAHLKLKEILKNIIIESCFFSYFLLRVFLLLFFLFAREKQNRKLKNKKKKAIFARRHTFKHVQSIIYFDFVFMANWTLTSRRKHLLNVRRFVDTQNLPSDMNINISAFRLR